MKESKKHASTNLNDADGMLEKRFRTLAQDGFQGSLNDGIGSHQTLAQLIQGIADLMIEKSNGMDARKENE